MKIISIASGLLGLRSRRISTSLFLATVISVKALGAEAPFAQEMRDAKGACEEPSSLWCKEYKMRQARLSDYIQNNRSDFKSFATASLGHGGFPYVLLRLAPELFPDLVAAQGKNFSRLGFSSDPLNPTSGLPLGLNYSSQGLQIGGLPIQTPLQVATLTCGACHIGRVAGPDGRVIDLVGAGNSHFDSSGLFKLFADIVNHPHYRADLVRQAIKEKPAGWFYGNDVSVAFAEYLERQLYVNFTDKILSTIKDGVLAGRAHQDLFINKTVYAPAGAASYFDRTPGRADAVGLTLANYANEDQLDKMPKAPTITKIMSVWSQKDRQVSHWTGDMPSGVHPVVAAEVAVVGDVKNLNQKNIASSTRFIDQLPPPPYPYRVDMDRAKRGQVLYSQYCASCHVGDRKVYPAEEVGTDPARLGATSDVTYEGFNKALHEGCPKKEMGSACYEDSRPILRPRDWALGYVATPLDGIWARAPYLHNGSVPTLYHLLVPSQRPQRFIVGSMLFDTEMVGFEWQKPMENTEVYETGRPAQMSGGHDTVTYLGLDWEAETEKRLDLIEYMKTL